MLEVRRFDPNQDSYDILVPAYNAVHVMWPSSSDELKRWDGWREPGRDFNRWLGFLNGEVTFVGDVGHSENTHRRGRRYMYPHGLANTHGTALEREYFDWLYNHTAEMDPYEIVTIVQSTQESVLKLFEEYGFVHRQRERVSVLQVEEFDPAEWTFAFEKAHQNNIELVCFTEIDLENDELLFELYELAKDLLHDVPQPDAHTMDSFEVYLKRIRSMPHNKNLRWYAKHEGKFIGQTAIIDNIVDPTMSYTGLTGVHRDYRRMGVATAIKLKSIIAAKSLGVRIIQTENEENNPMFDLNVRLGFEETLAWLQLAKSLREPTEEDLRQD